MSNEKQMTAPTNDSAKLSTEELAGFIDCWAVSMRQTIREVADFDPYGLHARRANLYDTMAARLRELEAEKQRLEEDAERYRFLRSERLVDLLDLFQTCDTSDVGLDYAIDCTRKPAAEPTGASLPQGGAS